MLAIVPFLLSPLGRIIGIALAAVLLIVGTYSKGAHDGAAKVEAKVKLEIAAEQARQKQASDATVAELKQELDARDADITAANGKAEAYAAALAKRMAEPPPAGKPAATACTITSEDADAINLK